MGKTINEKIKRLEKDIEQSKNQLKQFQQQQKEKDRKARTRRLIERGAILESNIKDSETLTNEQITEILIATLRSREGMHIITNVRAKGGNTEAAKTEAKAEGNG